MTTTQETPRLDQESPSGAAPDERLYITKKTTVWSRHERVVVPLVALIGILAVWEFLGHMNLWDPLFFSHPTEIWKGFLELTQGPIWSDLRVSGTEFIVGLAIAMAIGVPVGMILGTNRTAYMAFDPFIQAIYSTPILVLMPLLVIWFGLGMGSKIANVVLISTLPFVITTIEGLRTTDGSLLRAARSFGAKGFQLYRRIYFPSMLPFFITGLRLAIGKALIAVVVGEYISSNQGVGFRIRLDAEYFRTGKFLAGVALIVAFSVLVMWLVKILEHKLAPWRRNASLDD